MSVIIKGMQMPGNCFRCKINKVCNQRWFLNTDNRPDDCPLMEVPPHGRLVDADCLIDMKYRIDHPYYEYVEVVNVEDIDNAPTVIEAE